MNIKCRYSGLHPDCAVIVATGEPPIFGGHLHVYPCNALQTAQLTYNEFPAGVAGCSTDCRVLKGEGEFDV